MPFGAALPECKSSIMTDAAPALSYPFSDLPLPGQATEIKPGVLWLRMPLPFSLDHINLWACLLYTSDAADE